MTAWLASPYRSLGIYIGGSNRACTQANLSSSWVSTVEHQGWRLAPLYVGLQAPCVNHIGLQRIDPATAASQGTAAANDAIAQAHLYGLGVGPPIYFDMEGYDATDAACDLAVERFLSAWTGTLHANGYVAGVYSGAASGIPQLVKYYDSTTYMRPDDIWFAHWDLRATVFGDPFFGDQYWANHQRVHQYQGGHTETYGGVTINIDLDEIDATLNTYAGNGTIVFDTDRTGTRQVFALGADGVGVTRVTTGGYDDYAPAISPGGTRVAFTSTRSGNADVWLQNMDGTGLERLTFAPGFDGYPSWSPDGSKIAFQSDRTGNMDVWTIGSNGLGVHEVTFDTHVDERPSWSPSGLRIAFDSDRAGNTNIYTIPAGGGTVTELTFDAAGDRRPVYSPSGSTIAFQSTRSGNADIWLIPVSGGAVTRLTAVAGADYSASWSPDGTRIAFVSARTGQSEVFVMHADGSSVVQYTHVGTLNELPSWGN